MESLVFFVTWEAVKDRHEVDATLIVREHMRLWTEKGTKVAGNILHVSSYRASNIIHTECLWTRHTCMSNWIREWDTPTLPSAYNQQHTFNTSWAIFSSRGGSGCPVLSNSRFNIKDWVRHLSVNSTVVQQLLPLAVEGRVAYKTHHVWQYWSNTITSMYVFQLYQHVQKSAAQIFY